MSAIVSGSVIRIVATVECGGCGERFVVELDPATEGGADGDGAQWTVYDHVLDAVRGCGGEYNTSVQGETILCGKCTRIVDKSTPDPPTRGDVESCLSRRHDDETCDEGELDYRGADAD